MPELVDSYTQDNQFIATIPRTQAYTQGTYHHGVHAFIYNSQGQILIQQRAANKSTWPNHYDLSFAETGQAGETFDQTFARGITEELGIKQIKSQQLPKLFNGSATYDQYHVSVIYPIYIARYDGEIQIDPQEVQSHNFLTIEQIDHLLNDPQTLATPWFIQDWPRAKEQLRQCISQL